MKYPVTIEALGKAFSDTCGTEMPEDQKPFWEGFAGLLNDAYDAGVLAGAKRVAREAVCRV